MVGTQWFVLLGVALVAALSCSEGKPSESGRPTHVGGATSVGGGTHTGGGPACLPDHARGIALAVADLVETELELEGLAFFDYEEGYSGSFTRRAGGWLVGGYRGFWDVGDDGTRSFVSEDASGVYRFLTGDLDGDGVEDIVSSHYHSENGGLGSITVVWRRLPDGSLERRFDLGHSHVEDERFALGDLEGDGDLDLFTVRLRVPIALRHDGNFAFDEVEVGPELPLTHTNGEIVYVGLHDTNQDGWDDIVAVRHRNDGTETTFVVTFAGDGSGQFAEPLLENLVGFRPYEVQGGHDLTGDGIDDLVIVEAESSTSNIFVAEGTGNGGFRVLEPRSREIVTGYVLGDIDGDGTSDLLSPTAGGIFVDLAQGGGAFSSRIHRVALGPARPIALVSPSSAGPARVGLTISIPCQPACGDTCAGSCFVGRCFECTSNAECASGVCDDGTCDACTTGCGGASGAPGAAGAEHL